MTRIVGFAAALPTTAALLLAACAATPGDRPLAATAPATTSERPLNVVLILADDLGWQDVGFMGSTYYKTPRLDALAARGVVFTDAYANAPNCTPTRAALMSGLYSPRTGVYTVSSSTRGEDAARRLIPTENIDTLAARFVTLAETFKANGYATGHFGKWHLGSGPQTGPKAQGFDVNIGGSHRGAPGKGGYFAPYPIGRKDRADQQMPGLTGTGAKGEYLTDRLTDEAIAFIESNRERPFFAYIPHYAVHTPLEAKPGSEANWAAIPQARRQGDPVYAAMVASLDENVGRLADALERLGLMENTVFVFTSDNGGHGGATHMPGLRGQKGQLYEGGIRVPALVIAPGGARGKRVETPIISLDFYPTLAAMARLRLPEGIRLDGRSLAPAIRDGTEMEAVPLYWHMPVYLQTGRSFAGSPLEPPALFRNRPRGAIRDGRWKLIENFEDMSIELYDLEADPKETTDLAAVRPEIAGRLRAKLKSWQRAVDAPIPARVNPSYDPAFTAKAGAGSPE